MGFPREKVQRKSAATPSNLWLQKKASAKMQRKVLMRRASVFAVRFVWFCQLETCASAMNLPRTNSPCTSVTESFCGSNENLPAAEASRARRLLSCQEKSCRSNFPSEKNDCADHEPVPLIEIVPPRRCCCLMTDPAWARSTRKS